MAQSYELQQRIAEWRLLVADKSTPDDVLRRVMREAVIALREGRVSAAYSSEASKRKKAVKEIPNADDLLSELMP